MVSTCPIISKSSNLLGLFQVHPPQFVSLSPSCSIVFFSSLARSRYFSPFSLSFIIFTNHSARAGYDTKSIFKRSLTGLNSEVFLLSFILTLWSAGTANSFRTRYENFSIYPLRSSFFFLNSTHCDQLLSGTDKDRKLTQKPENKYIQQQQQQQ